MKKVFTILMLLAANLIFAQNFHFENKDYTCNYSIKNGMMDGNFSMFYKNGKKKCEGQFLNNQKVGAWTAWDSSGNKKTTRNYKNDFEYESLFPFAPDNKENKSNYKLQYNKDGVIEMFDLKVPMIVYSKRLWRDVYSKENKDLFNLDLLIDTTLNILKDNRGSAYEKDDFEKACDYNSISEKLKSSKIIGIRLMEEMFFDNVRKLMEVRIIGIAPIIQTQTDTAALCWFYYPNFRKNIGRIPINKDIKPVPLKSMDDVFVFRSFKSILYKEDNAFDTPIPRNKLKKLNEAIILDILNAEIDCWMKFAE